MSEDAGPLEGVAIVGMTGRFPGARNLGEFWGNLVAGVESVSHFSEEELEPSRLETPGMRDEPNYVRARAVLEDADAFDAGFFGISPREAAVMDPQHRVFLEAAWSALESAGYDPDAYQGSIGVWAGMSNSTYYVENVLTRPDITSRLGAFASMIANEKDFLSTRVSYKLNLRGPSVNVYTACSTSLVAVCEAYHALMGYRCDMALAGGVTVSVPQRRGYLYHQGAIGSPDGRCRPFDARAAGTVFGDGVGVVALKRLEDARADGDFVHAVIRGAAVNNDGSGKVSYTAPSVDGQAEVILMAQALAGVGPDSVSYVEAHGTATPLGDPIEVAALTQAFRGGTQANQYCAIGSVKGNVGHLDAAAGVAGLIKTVLALKHRELPPSLHFEEPNPEIDFAGSPFFVNDALRPWNGSGPRRAGVSSFGIGGTNAHVVLEEAPGTEAARPRRHEALLVVSARTETALERASALLADHLSANPAVSLEDVAFTLQVGRRHFSHRRAVAGRSVEEMAAGLRSTDATRVCSGHVEGSARRIAFLFPGQGAQRAGMGAALYRSEPVFAAEIDGCAEALRSALGLDLRSLIFPDPDGHEDAERRLTQTALTQPALFSVELALARLWMSWGVEPTAMIGHSLGEYVAACVAGVFTRDEAATLVATRGRLMQSQSRGAMLAVRCSAADLESRLLTGVVIAAVNAPELTVASGPEPLVRKLEVGLTAEGFRCHRLATSHAFHSPMMDPVLVPFREALAGLTLAAPERPWVSGLTGDWITPEQAVDRDYWVRQLREPVRFSEGLARLARDPDLALLEVGPGHTLTGLARQHRDRPPGQAAIASLDREEDGDVVSVLEALGRLWVTGVSPDWAALNKGAPRRRVPLPTYSFERDRFWVDAAPLDEVQALPADAKAGTEGDSERATAEAEEVPTGDDDEFTPTQSLVLEVYRDALGVADVDLHDNFFDLGGESLLAVQVIEAIEKRTGHRLPARAILLGTVEQVAVSLQAEEETAG